MLCISMYRVSQRWLIRPAQMQTIKFGAAFCRRVFGVDKKDSLGAKEKIWTAVVLTCVSRSRRDAKLAFGTGGNKADSALLSRKQMNTSEEYLRAEANRTFTHRRTSFLFG